MITNYSVKDFGSYSFFLAFISIFSKSSGFSIGNILIREFSINKKIFLQGFYIQCFGGVFFGILAYISAYFFEVESNSKIAIYFSVPFFLFMGFNVYSIKQFALNRHWIAATYSFSIFIFAAFLKYYIIFNKMPIYYLGLTFGIETFLPSFFLWIFNRKENYFEFPNFTKIFDIIKEAIPLIFSTFSIILYLRLDQLMISSYLGHEELGYYSLSVRLSEIWLIIPSVLIATNFPKLVKLNHQNNNISLRWGSGFYGFFNFYTIIQIIIYLLLGHFIINLINPVYSDSYYSLIVLSFANLFGNYGIVTHKLLLLNKKTSRIFTLDVLGLVSNLFLNIIFIPLFGINGAAIATFLSYFIGNYFSLIFFKDTRYIFTLINKTGLSFSFKDFTKILKTQFGK